MKGIKQPWHILLFFAVKLGEPGVLLISMWPLCEKTVFRIQWKVAVEIFTSVHRSSGKKQRSPLGKNSVLHWEKARLYIGKRWCFPLGKSSVLHWKRSSALHWKKSSVFHQKQQCSPFKRERVLNWGTAVFSIGKKQCSPLEKKLLFPIGNSVLH